MGPANFPSYYTLAGMIFGLREAVITREIPGLFFFALSSIVRKLAAAVLQRSAISRRNIPVPPAARDQI